jgi:chitinase
MRALVLCAILYAQLTWAIPSDLSPTHRKRSHSQLAADLSRRQEDACEPYIASSWYAGWHSSDVPLANVSWSKYTCAIYAFA